MHLPFCVSKCRYCDFNSYAWTGEDLSRHVDAVLAEATLRAASLQPQTVFVGGGTPSFLPPELLSRLLRCLDDITGFRSSATEVTLEANPESFDRETAEAACQGGVDRISIGVQSLRPEVLAAYDRVHSPADALAAFHTARHAGFQRINVDLIYAFPGQDPAEWEQDLRRILALEPEHVSCYELSYEPGTALTRLRDAGRWPEEDAERCRALFDRTRAVCGEHGYGQYEVSNYARPEEACRHNLVYWRSLPFVGVGAGASSWQHGERRKNLERPDEYERALRQGADPVGSRERPAPRTTLFDVFLMGLRLPAEGVSLARAARISGLDAETELGAAIDAGVGDGLLERTVAAGGDARVRVTAAGLPVLDRILEEMLPRMAV